MKTYNSYLIRKIASSFLVIATILVLLIWFSKAVSLIVFITEKGVSILDFFNLFILILPWLLLIIIPISLFISILVSYNQMMNHNEIVILENAGLDKFTLAKPALFIATLCCLLCFFISFFLMPYANKKLRTIRTDFNHNYANLLISPGIFENLNSLTIYAKNRDSSNSLSGILIYDRRNPEHSSAITSESGVLSQKGNSVLLYLGKGTAQKFNYKTRKTDILNFDSYVVNLQDSNKAEISLKWKAGERYINELLNPEGEVSDKNLRKYYVELHQRIIYPFLSVVLAFIACAFILNQQFKRHGNIAHNVKAVIAASIFVGFLMAGFDLIQNFPRLVGLLYADLLIFVFLSYLILKPKTKN